ncbi:hypothetical protein [Candidatus Nitrosarchaeum limnium]|jgi:hypothetical protein|uniref:Uncharacterized protein n=2 Tax=Candidatus Nitrosarchaeum limnium TaxID=1007084 RepID=S2DZ67_9ARCH|nr:hypothetical protein [Candidatus Nitrosarchaeum limnium]EGG42514.1 Hypothetical protein Nlim_0695 [Candidatus Nitrosarchaeum limnium SFB1]EPA04450.1 hypothetical protein BG20_I2223 [Candidatus Nitrosarchaeum limnium BG20]
MNAYIGFFLLFSVLVTGLIVNPSNIVFADTTGNSTNTNLSESIQTGDDMVNPEHMMDQDNSTKTLDEEMNTGDVMEKPSDEMMEHEDAPVMILSPLKQVKDGVASKDVVCREGLELAFKLNGQAACVKSTSIEKLVVRGWTQ